jgi:tetratricopeptide (TPR) repeat protein
VTDQNPDYAAAYYYQGLLYRNMNEPQKAIEQYRKAVEKDDAFLPAINNLAYLYAEHGENLEEALRIIEPFAERYPRELALQDTYAWILHKAGQDREALKVIDRVPENVRDAVPEALYHRGVILFHAGELAEAKVELEKALGKIKDPEKESEIRQLLSQAGSGR